MNVNLLCGMNWLAITDALDILVHCIVILKYVLTKIK